MSKEFIPCNENGCKDGHIYYVENGVDTVEPCICRLKHEHEAKLVSKYISANLPKKSWSYNISDYVGADKNGNIPKLKKFVNNFDEKIKDKTLHFLGSQGVQKSTVARWLVKEMIKRGKSAHYNLVDDVLKNLIKLKEEDKSFDELEMLNNDLVIFDEFDPLKVTVWASGYQLSFLTTFLKKRLELVGKCTIFINNDGFKTEAFAEKFGKTLVDMLTREIYGKDGVDGTLIFEDNYEALSKDFEVDSLWA